MVVPLILGGAIGFLIAAVTVRFIGEPLPPVRTWTLVVLAIGNGIFFALNVSPIGTVSAEIVAMSPALPTDFQAFVVALLYVEAVITHVIGSIVLVWSGRVITAVMFGLALAAGYLLPIAPNLGLLLAVGVVLLAMFTVA